MVITTTDLYNYTFTNRDVSTEFQSFESYLQKDFMWFVSQLEETEIMNSTPITEWRIDADLHITLFINCIETSLLSHFYPYLMGKEDFKTCCNVIRQFIFDKVSQDLTRWLCSKIKNDCLGIRVYETPQQQVILSLGNKACFPVAMEA